LLTKYANPAGRKYGVVWLLGISVLLLTLTHFAVFGLLHSVAKADTTIWPVGACGDQNEDNMVNVLDTILDLKFSVGPSEPEAHQYVKSDLDSDAEITIADAEAGIQHIVGLRELPDCGPIEVTDADAVYYVITKPVAIDTEIVPIDNIFVNDEDSMESKTLRSVTIDTEIVPINSIFFNDEDSAADIDLTPVSIDTEIEPIEGLFVNNADQTINRGLESPP
jgi:hypothetical protein